MLGKNGNRLCNSNFSINASTRGEKIKFGLIEALNLKDNTTFFLTMMHWKKYLLMERKYKLPWKPLILNSSLPFFKNYAGKWHLPIMAVNITQLLTRYEGSIWFGPEGTFFAQGQRPRATLLSKVRPTNYMLPESMSITGDYCVTWTSIYVVCSKYS